MLEVSSMNLLRAFIRSSSDSTRAIYSNVATLRDTTRWVMIAHTANMAETMAVMRMASTSEREAIPKTTGSGVGALSAFLPSLLFEN